MLLCALIFTLFPYTTLFRSHGQVGAGQVSRATQQLRQDSAKLFDRILRRFTSGQFFGVFLNGLDKGIRLSGEVFGQITLRSEEHTSELQSRGHLVCRLLLEKKNK